VRLFRRFSKSASACALERPGNVLYQWNFVRDLKRRMRRKERFRSGRFDLAKLNAVRTVREFDETYTAPYFGFRNAEDYYHRASSMRVIDRICVPALIITAEDDPFVPSQPFHDPKVTGNRHITLSTADTAATVASSALPLERTTDIGRKTGSSRSSKNRSGHVSPRAEDSLNSRCRRKQRRSISCRADCGPFPASSCGY
jgi:hypothetical protein